MVENLLSHVSLPRYQLDTLETHAHFSTFLGHLNTERADTQNTHRLSGLWVVHRALVKVKLAVVVLWEEIGRVLRKLRQLCVQDGLLLLRGEQLTCLDKQFAASVSQQLVQPNLHLE